MKLKKGNKVRHEGYLSETLYIVTGKILKSGNIEVSYNERCPTGYGFYLPVKTLKKI